MLLQTAFPLAFICCSGFVAALVLMKVVTSGISFFRVGSAGGAERKLCGPW